MGTAFYGIAPSADTVLHRGKVIRSVIAQDAEQQSRRKERASDERADNTDNGQQVFNLAFKEVSNSLVQADALLGVLLGTR